MPTVRTTMQPDVEIEVSEVEALSLAKQGLLAADPEPAPVIPAVVQPTPAPTAPARAPKGADKPSEG